ncbi:hypothetical protein TWF173_003509 [Orbilia oligospora]|nr:hypothetical protein TWF173_003509 [Orbilia oligospora]
MVFRPYESSHHGRPKFFVTLLSLTTISVVVSSPVLHTSRTGSGLSTSAPNVSKTLIYSTTPTLLANKPVSGTSACQPTGSKIIPHIAYKHRTGQAVDTSTATDKGAQISAVSSGELVRSPSASTILTAAATASLASATETEISAFGLETAPNNYKRVLSPSLFYKEGIMKVECPGNQDIIDRVVRPFFEGGVAPKFKVDVTMKWPAETTSLRRNHLGRGSPAGDETFRTAISRLTRTCRRCLCDHETGIIIHRGADNMFRTKKGTVEGAPSCIKKSRAEFCSLFLGCYCTAFLVSDYNDLSEESRNAISQHPIAELQGAINRIPGGVRVDNPGWLFLFGDGLDIAQDSFRVEDMAAQSTGYTFEDEDDDVDPSEWEPDEFLFGPDQFDEYGNLVALGGPEWAHKTSDNVGKGKGRAADPDTYNDGAGRFSFNYWNFPPSRWNGGFGPGGEGPSSGVIFKRGLETLPQRQGDIVDSDIEVGREVAHLEGSGDLEVLA